MDWWKSSTPETIQPYPWLHPAAVCYLDALLTPDMSVIEHGCGGSTLWFAARVKTIASIDDNADWVATVAERLSRGNALIMVGKYPPKGRYDMLLIDGNNHDRPKWITAAPGIVKAGGWVVVDNAERPHYRVALAELQKHCESPVVITAWTPYGKLVRTDFYRMK